jgi:CheY-like chemotaxis protein
MRRTDTPIDQMLVFSVSDTGIGIAAENLERVFAPFEQVDAAPDRRYGGTGLGLSIAREMAILLGGDLQVTSTLGHGSTFRLFLPERWIGTSKPLVRANGTAASAGHADPRPSPDDAYVLVIEDDPHFAEICVDAIQAQGLKARVASDGASGLRAAHEQAPSGIVLDVQLPDLDGWNVMEALRKDKRTAAIPVHFVSAGDGRARALAMGAIGYLTKPATRADLKRVIESLVPPHGSPHRILVVEDDAFLLEAMVDKLTDERLEVHRAPTAREAREAIATRHFDCMILDLSLPDMDGLELLEALDRDGTADRPAVVIYTARSLTKGETRRLETYAEAIVLKDGLSSDRLIDEVRLFMQRLKTGLGRRRPTAVATPTDTRLAGKKVLVVDDDMRTVYALSATLMAKGADVLVADTGRTAIENVFSTPDIAVVLMDMMMPEMDGYEAMQRIRADSRFRALPIIALTAKAMVGDRDKCLAAGATDYMAKPIDPDRLISIIRERLA